MSRVVAAAGLLLILAAVAWSYGSGGIAAVMLATDLTAADKLDALRAFFADLGPAAPLAYVAIVTVEVVVAPIPGTILYAPGGVVFGGLWGGTLSLIGNVVGAGLSFVLMRALGRAAVARFIEHERLGAYETRLVDNGVWIVFLLRVNPLTSSDIVSYAAGATAMPIRKLLTGTALGMAPLCYAQAYMAEGLLAAFPALIYPLLVVGLAYAAAFVWLLRRAARD